MEENVETSVVEKLRRYEAGTRDLTPSVFDLAERADGSVGLAVAGPTRIERIIELEEEAVKVIGSYYSNRWEAARLYAEEADEGATQREIAEWVGKSQPHVQRMVRAWHEYGSTPETERPDFVDAYRKAKEPREPRDTRGIEAEPEVIEGEVVVDMVSVLGTFDPSGLSADELRAILNEAEAFVENVRAWIIEAEE
jgi:hypothetical protein